MQSVRHPFTIRRHARLFELLRQENMALLARAKPPARPAADIDAAMKFRQMAERSLSGAAEL